MLIHGGRVIDPARGVDGPRDVLIRDGRIAAVEPDLGKRAGLRGLPSLEAKGKWVTPGLIDLHVHLREPGGERAETIATGSAAAARGGFTTVLAMPNTQPPADQPRLLADLRRRARAAAKVNVLFAAAVTVGQRGERLTDFERLLEAGAVAFSDDGRPVADAGLMRRALERSRSLDVAVIAHCEDPGLAGPGVMNEGRWADLKGLRGIPRAGETAMAMRDIILARATRGNLHIAHVSALGTVAAVRQAKAWAAGPGGAAGRVTCEAAPHHWTLCDSDIPGLDADFKMNPPLRSEDDRSSVISGLADGVIDAIASDHAPHPAARKALGFRAAPFGVIGLETSLGLALTRLAGRALSPSRLIELMSAAPARILRLESKGSLAVGKDADLTVIDPAASWTVRPPFASRSSNSPFTGMRLTGRACATIVKGEVVYAL
ncbi:MAG: dihydroorotase [Elusimicrobia bacterium]|nr:dihydroorotase [Elusimicrobiota bacterium]